MLLPELSPYLTRAHKGNNAWAEKKTERGMGERPRTIKRKCLHGFGARELHTMGEATRLKPRIQRKRARLPLNCLLLDNPRGSMVEPLSVYVSSKFSHQHRGRSEGLETGPDAYLFYSSLLKNTSLPKYENATPSRRMLGLSCWS